MCEDKVTCGGDHVWSCEGKEDNGLRFRICENCDLNQINVDLGGNSVWVDRNTGRDIMEELRRRSPAYVLDRNGNINQMHSYPTACINCSSLRKACETCVWFKVAWIKVA